MKARFAMYRFLISALTIFSFCLSLLIALPVTTLAGPHLVLVPKINLPEKEFDLGVVSEGIEVRHTFKIENQGQKDLVITGASSTCGCTVPHIKNKRIAPGKTGDLEVIMDTSMKQGDVSKAIEIRCNDPMNHINTVYIKAKVISPHADLGPDRTSKIFTGRCAACHVNNGVGKTGEDLFFADCAMCHGYRARGIPSVAPALTPFDYSNKDFAAAMKKIIAEGSKSHRSMPGYAKEHGGPLDAKQIDSLIEYLKWKSDLDRKSSGS